ncbi:MAG: response regulator [Syntrophobacteraceae bacterium]|nr:response regulator [Desulfobacteraceae bacterium]
MDEKPLTVLVVDDDESVRKAMKRLLVSNGYRVLTFESAEDLLVSSFARGNVCLVLDICLPGLSGLDLYARLSASGVKCPVIFMTAHDEPRWLEMAERAGAVAFLRKPFEEHSLLDAVVRSQVRMKSAGNATG